jgi:DNA-binding NarL/FixJ family response regulator
VFQLIVGGASVSDIAQQLNLSVKTVSTHKARLMEKMGLANQAELIHYAIRHRLSDDSAAPG